MDAPRASAIIVAAGQGRRMGGMPKVLLHLAGKPVIAYALDAIQEASSVTEIVLVGSATTLTEFEALRASAEWPKLARVVAGGERRQDSVAAGLAAIDPSADVVVVHDGARPFATSILFDECVEVARQFGAAIAAVPAVDTLKRVRDGTVEATIDRANLWAAQTPQAVRAEMLREAMQHGLDVTDEAMLMEAIGQTVRIVEGARFNLKITHPADLALAEAFARAKRDQS
jgi:2-C-methyl-D-erythritol 4-phosphate cytidylyltransferase